MQTPNRASGEAHDAPEAANAASLRERAEALAGKLSVRQLTPEEAAEAVDIIFDLLANQRTGRIIHGDA